MLTYTECINNQWTTSPELEVFREDTCHAISMSANWTVRYPCVPITICTLQKLNICSMQCTSYYIGYLQYNKAGCRDGSSKGFWSTLVPTCHTPWQLFADQLHRVTDQSHKVNGWPHEATDRHHQAHIGTFGIFDTNSTPYFTQLSNGSLMPSHPREWSEWLPRSQAPTQLFSILAGNKETGEREHVLGVRIYAWSPLYTSGWLYENGGQYQCYRSELEKQRSELLWSLSGIHTLIFRLPCHCRVQELLNVQISKIFTQKFSPDWRDRQTD